MEYRKLKDEDSKDAYQGNDLESVTAKHGAEAEFIKTRGVAPEAVEWKRKTFVTVALTVLTSSQGILIAWSKRSGHYDYSVTTANFLVEVLKCFISVLALLQVWKKEGITEDNKLGTTLDEVKVYPIPAALYLVKNLLQYYIFIYVDAPSYQILKNFNIISTGLLYWWFLNRKLNQIQWSAFILLALGCTTAQLNSSSDHVLQTPIQGWTMAIIMALLSGFAGVYTEAIMKKRPARNINVQNFWLYVFGVIFNAVAIFVQDFDDVANKGFFHGYSISIVCMIVNHALRPNAKYLIAPFASKFYILYALLDRYKHCGLAVSMVMKFADNLVKVYSTSIAMLLTAFLSMLLFGFQLSLPFLLGTMVVSVAVYLHSQGKMMK